MLKVKFSVNSIFNEPQETISKIISVLSSILSYGGESYRMINKNCKIQKLSDDSFIRKKSM